MWFGTLPQFFCFTDLHFNLVIFRHAVFSKGQGIKIYDIDKLNSI